MNNIVNKWILRITPVLAPMPTAYVIYGKLVTVLDWETWIAFVAAAVIELIGFRSIGLAVEMYQFNRSLNATEKTLRAPLWLASSVVGLYTLAVLSLTILLEILPALSQWTPIAFVVMGLVGGGLLATLSSDQEAREQKRAEAKAKALKTRAENKKSVAGATQSAKVQLQVRASATHSANSATDSIAPARTYPRQCEHCTDKVLGLIRTPQSVGAHMKKHHPELCKPSKSLAVAQFTNALVVKAEKPQ